MVENRVYELSVVRGTDTDRIELINPTDRITKHAPNSMDIVRTAIMTVSGDLNLNTVMFDITAMSFAMRMGVYESAQSYASTTRKVIISFGSGRPQEWNQMLLGSFSYIAIDPQVSVDRITKLMPRARILP